MSGAKYILFFILYLNILCKFCSNRSTNKKVSKNWVSPLKGLFFYRIEMWNKKILEIIFVYLIMSKWEQIYSNLYIKKTYFQIQYVCQFPYPFYTYSQIKKTFKLFNVRRIKKNVVTQLFDRRVTLPTKYPSEAFSARKNALFSKHFWEKIGRSCE